MSAGAARRSNALPTHPPCARPARRGTLLPPAHSAPSEQPSGPAATTTSASYDTPPAGAPAAGTPRPDPSDPADLASLVRQLDALLEAAGADGGEGAASRKAEDAATALAARGRELGLLRGYGAGRQVPKRLYTIEELRLNKVEADKLLSPNDTSLNSVRTICQAAAAAGLLSAAYLNHWDTGGVLMALFGCIFVLVADQARPWGSYGNMRCSVYGRVVANRGGGEALFVALFRDRRVANGGGGEALLVDSLGRLLRPSYASRVAYHEAGHLLVAYLFSQKKADGEVRWAVLNCAAILRRHAGLHDELAAAMRSGRSVGQCIQLLELRLANCPDI
ncbi:hypothetical protein TSOC_002596 [Tetrabaena socialis]|uniref:Peptidase M41 domain-containing protein n=1 Tax=Tetrabaena socialis TaxID=47790 RepID=A0A2J8ADS0_9CHLO|nr:hypothetical protein TSOC_002596 [Tetrabaena socialis]|eukprot:PNH10660.1 hypothetical protein TSOC_002596 [Tetrabaena socialis]